MKLLVSLLVLTFTRVFATNHPVEGQTSAAELAALFGVGPAADDNDHDHDHPEPAQPSPPAFTPPPPPPPVFRPPPPVFTPPPPPVFTPPPPPPPPAPVAPVFTPPPMQNHFPEPSRPTHSPVESTQFMAEMPEPVHSRPFTMEPVRNEVQMNRGSHFGEETVEEEEEEFVSDQSTDFHQGSVVFPQSGGHFPSSGGQFEELIISSGEIKTIFVDSFPSSNNFLQPQAHHMMEMSQVSMPAPMTRPHKPKKYEKMEKKTGYPSKGGKQAPKKKKSKGYKPKETY